jgi:transcriptional regulator with XRE-family HTH domain
LRTSIGCHGPDDMKEGGTGTREVPSAVTGREKTPVPHPRAGGPQEAFAQFVRHAVDTARRERGWPISETAAHTGVGRSTVFRWLNGDWNGYPQLERVRRFCRNLDLPVTEAMRALGMPAIPVTPSGPRAPEASVDADVRLILTRLSGPAVAAEDKQHVRLLLHYLASRSLRRTNGGSSPPSPPRRPPRVADAARGKTWDAPGEQLAEQTIGPYRIPVVVHQGRRQVPGVLDCLDPRAIVRPARCKSIELTPICQRFPSWYEDADA